MEAERKKISFSLSHRFLDFAAAPDRRSDSCFALILYDKFETVCRQ